jgi:hypothetical protein
MSPMQLIVKYKPQIERMCRIKILMMHFKCHNCNKDILVNQMVGTLPPQVVLNTFCSEGCLNDAHQKVKDKTANDNS